MGVGWGGHVMCVREAPAEVSAGEALTASAPRRHVVTSSRRDTLDWTTATLLLSPTTGLTTEEQLWLQCCSWRKRGRKQSAPFTCARRRIQHRLIIIWGANAILISHYIGSPWKTEQQIIGPLKVAAQR